MRVLKLLSLTITVDPHPHPPPLARKCPRIYTNLTSRPGRGWGVRGPRDPPGQRRVWPISSLTKQMKNHPLNGRGYGRYGRMTYLNSYPP